MNRINDWMTWIRRISLTLCLSLVASLVFCNMAVIELKDEKWMQTVFVPGFFKIVFRQNALVIINPGERSAKGAKIAEIYDLENDPDAKVNLCCASYDAVGSGVEAGRLKVLESSPVRIVIKNTGTVGTDEKVKIAKKYVIYPNGKVYIREVFESEPKSQLLGMSLNASLALIPAEQFADPVDDEIFWFSWGGDEFLSNVKSQSYFGLFYGTENHPKYFTDKSPKKNQGNISVRETRANILMVLHYRSERVYYWGRWVMGKDKGDLNMTFSQSALNGCDLKGSNTLTYLFQMKPNAMYGTEAAKPYASDYRNPGALTVTKGSPVLDDEDDLNKDGYNEAEGCYLVKSAADGVEFSLDCKKKRFDPAFKVEEWNAAAPESIEVNGSKLTRGTGYLAEVPEGSKDLILQVAGSYDKSLAIKIIKKQ